MTTIEEATKLLKMSEQAIWLKGLEKEQKEAKDMAIKSLEAWEKIRKDIKAESDELMAKRHIGDRDFWNSGRIYAFGEVLVLIDKHLSEVSK